MIKLIIVKVRFKKKNALSKALRGFSVVVITNSCGDIIIKPFVFFMKFRYNVSF
jgi:hypothetical protein